MIYHCVDRPSFVMPYMTALSDDVANPLFLRRFGVPYWTLAHVFGKYPMYWYRLEPRLAQKHRWHHRSPRRCTRARSGASPYSNPAGFWGTRVASLARRPSLWTSPLHGAPMDDTTPNGFARSDGEPLQKESDMRRVWLGQLVLVVALGGLSSASKTVARRIRRSRGHGRSRC